MQAFEVTETLNSTGQLTLDQPLQVAHPGRVRVIVLVSDRENVSSNGDRTDPPKSITKWQGLAKLCQERSLFKLSPGLPLNP
jgi:hypothetical protein